MNIFCIYQDDITPKGFLTNETIRRLDDYPESNIYYLDITGTINVHTRHKRRNDIIYFDNCTGEVIIRHKKYTKIIFINEIETLLEDKNDYSHYSQNSIRVKDSDNYNRQTFLRIFNSNFNKIAVRDNENDVIEASIIDNTINIHEVNTYACYTYGNMNMECLNINELVVHNNQCIEFKDVNIETLILRNVVSIDLNIDITKLLMSNCSDINVYGRIERILLDSCTDIYLEGEFTTLDSMSTTQTFANRDYIEPKEIHLGSHLGMRPSAYSKSFIKVMSNFPNFVHLEKLTRYTILMEMDLMEMYILKKKMDIVQRMTNRDLFSKIYEYLVN